MKVAGYIMMVVGIISGIAVFIISFAEKAILTGFFIGVVTIYFTVCSSLSIIYAAEVPGIQGTASHSLLTARSNGENISKLKTEITNLKSENNKLFEKILMLENKINDKGEKND